MGVINVYNVEDFGAVHDGQTDDTGAIQSAINHAFAQGGGTVYFPNGIYIIAGALQNDIEGLNYNSQLYVPPSGDLIVRPVVLLQGEQMLSYTTTAGIGTLVPRHEGAILRSTIEGSGVFPSVIASIGNAPGVQVNFNQCNINSLEFQLKENANNKLTVGGINFKWANCTNIDQVQCTFTSINASDSGEPNVVEIAGIYLPTINCNGGVYARNVTTIGFTHGVIINENAIIDNFLAKVCTNGFSLESGYHAASFYHINALWCKNNINIINDGITPNVIPFTIKMLDTEWSQPGKWYDSQYTINDPGNRGMGTVNYHIVEAAVGINNAKFSKNGGVNIIESPI